VEEGERIGGGGRRVGDRGKWEKKMLDGRLIGGKVGGKKKFVRHTGGDGNRDVW